MEEFKENENPNLFELIVKEIWKDMKPGFYLMFFASMIQVPLPMLLKWYLQWFKSETGDFSEGYLYAFSICFLVFLKPTLTMQA